MDLGTWGLLVLGGVVIGGGTYLLMLIHRFCTDGENKRLDRLLRECDVRPSYLARRALQRDFWERERWSLVGGVGLVVIATGLVGPHVDGSDPGRLYVVAFPACYLGWALGSVLVGLVQLRRVNGRMRVTSLSLRRLADYLPGQELTTERTIALVGGFTVLAAAETALGWTPIPTGDHAVIWMLGLGGLSAFAAGTALLLQRMIVESGAPAANEDELVVADVLRALVVRDLTTMVAITIAAATWGIALSSSHPDWLLALYAPIALVGAVVLGGRRKRRDRTPVATALTGFESTRGAA